MPKITTVLLAGGKGSRLAPITEDHAKPAVPFGGVYKIIDFTLSNCVNSGFNQVFVLTQFKSMSLERHINRTWRGMVNSRIGEFIETVPAQQRLGENWYQGNADAVYQNIYCIEKERPDHVVVLAGDHIYKMDYRDMLEQHISKGAAVTIGGLPVPVEKAAGQFGVMQIDSNSKIIGFEEKPEKPKPLPTDEATCLASMGIYIFEADFLFDQLCKNAMKEGTRHDFGRNVIPDSMSSDRVYSFEFRNSATGEPGYWRDVGTLDSFFDANMDLLSKNSEMQLEDSSWPIWHANNPCAPAKVFRNSLTENNSDAANIISCGCVIHGDVSGSVLGPRCVIGKGASVENCILFEDVRVEPGAKIKNAIVTGGMSIPSNSLVGNETTSDFLRSENVTPEGRVIISDQNDCNLRIAVS